MKIVVEGFWLNADGLKALGEAATGKFKHWGNEVPLPGQEDMERVVERNIGAIASAGPLAMILKFWSWRPVFLVLGGVTIGLALLTLLFFRRADLLSLLFGCQLRFVQLCSGFRFWVRATRWRGGLLG